MPTISIYLPEDEYLDLIKFAKTRGKTKSEVIREALRIYYSKKITKKGQMRL